MGQGKGQAVLLNGNRIHQIRHDPVNPHYRLFNGARVSCIKIQRLFLKELGGVPRVEGNGTQRIFNLMGNGGQEGGLGIIKGAQSQILFLRRSCCWLYSFR